MPAKNCLGIKRGWKEWGGDRGNTRWGWGGRWGPLALAREFLLCKGIRKAQACELKQGEVWFLKCMENGYMVGDEGRVEGGRLLRTPLCLRREGNYALGQWGRGITSRTLNLRVLLQQTVPEAKLHLILRLPSLLLATGHWRTASLVLSTWLPLPTGCLKVLPSPYYMECSDQFPSLPQCPGSRLLFQRSGSTASPG